MEVGDGNSCSEDGIVWVGDSHVCSSFCGLENSSADDRDAFARVENVFTYQVIKLYCRNTLVDTRDDLLCDCSCINMVGIESVAQSRDTSCDLVELNALLASV